MTNKSFKYILQNKEKTNCEIEPVFRQVWQILKKLCFHSVLKFIIIHETLVLRAFRVDLSCKSSFYYEQGRGDKLTAKCKMK
jgi:hypothetical protein